MSHRRYSEILAEQERLRAMPCNTIREAIAFARAAMQRNEFRPEELPYIRRSVADLEREEGRRCRR